MISFFGGSYRLASLCLILLASALMTSPVQAANCSATNITLNSQAAVDTFQATYGPCDTVTGNLDVAGGDISNLAGLSALTAVEGQLELYNNDSLSNVNGLSSLTHVGGNLNIYLHDFLVSLDGLSALTSVGDVLSIVDNKTLPDLDGLSALTSVGVLDIAGNALLSNLDGLSGLTGVPGILSINSNPALTSVDGLSSITSVGGYLEIVSTSLTNLDGLSGVISVGDAVAIVFNPVLENVDGLRNLISVGTDLSVFSNARLDNCSGLTALLDPIDDGAPGPGPGAAGIPDVGTTVSMSENLPGCNRTEPQPVEGTALLTIQKSFTDHNFETPVTLKLHCTNGSYSPASVTILPNGNEIGYALDAHTFVVGKLPVRGTGAVCTVTEEPVAGYSAQYLCPQNLSDSPVDANCVPAINGNPDSLPANNVACKWSNVLAGESNYCLIINNPEPVEVEVTKVWDVTHAGGDYFDRDAEITIVCNSEMSPGQNKKGNWYYRKNLKDSDYVNGQYTITVEVVPDYPSSSCFAKEDHVYSAVEVTSDCGDFKAPGMEVSVGEGDSCTITNTLFFEGIPTLNRSGMAIMALLMLGMGLVGFRRFA